MSIIITSSQLDRQQLQVSGLEEVITDVSGRQDSGEDFFITLFAVYGEIILYIQRVKKNK